VPDEDKKRAMHEPLSPEGFETGTKYLLKRGYR
jgi:hypothetical protein